MIAPAQIETVHELFGQGISWGLWEAADDGLMGGISQSRFLVDHDGTGVFVGNLSLENQGGFASVRSPQMGIRLPRASGLRFHVRGDGHFYTACLHTQGLQPGTSYRCRFQPVAYEWQTIGLAFDEFVLMRYGQRVGISPVKPERICGLSLMISDRQEGAFALEVASVGVYATA